MPRPKTSKCRTCGFAVCSVCHGHRLPGGAGKAALKALCELRHGQKEVPWCGCTEKAGG